MASITPKPDYTVTDELLMARIKKSKALTIVLTAMPEMGHFIPCVRQAEALEAAGHTVHLVVFQYQEDRCR